MTGGKVLRQIRNSWIVPLENWWELEGSAACSTSGQLPTSAEIEEFWVALVRGIGHGVRC